MTTATTKIVIVAGQEFSVPTDTDNEQIRATLKPNFPDVATAEIKLGTRKVGDEEVQTVEFVKKAGTKGLDGGELATLLRSVAPVEPPKVPRAPAAPPLLHKLLAGQLTADEALANIEPLCSALDACCAPAPRHSEEGARLCAQLDTLDAVPAPALAAGW